MIHVKKNIFHATDGNIRDFFDKLIVNKKNFTMLSADIKRKIIDLAACGRRDE